MDDSEKLYLETCTCVDYCECFVCGGGSQRIVTIILAGVKDTDTAIKISNMFEIGTKLEFLGSPYRHIVKIGACKLHVDNLNKLRNSIGYSNNSYITRERIQEARGL